MQNSNCPNGETTISPDLQDMIMSALPRELADWLRYEAATDYHPGEMWLAWREGHRPHSILTHVRGYQRKQTRKIYGASHPQASLFP
jgi:hypothetical protein